MSVVPVVLLGGCGGSSTEGSTDDPTQIADYSSEITIENHHSERHQVGIAITDEAGEEYARYDESISPTATVTHSPFSELESTGREEFSVEIILDDREPITTKARMTECFGDILVTILEDGSLDVTYSIC